MLGDLYKSKNMIDHREAMRKYDGNDTSETLKYWFRPLDHLVEILDEQLPS